ncbi:DUF6473 family protein [Roseibacterium beibuensis]|uniref:DUF6473 family protein n=1 Tax=[Roseibacterium] beibuensis TaxID=1193142 RepID=A0ABP9LDH9_9RHOB|nr:DUF6473 family protein [Roseibacterium beibuensis]MCS6626712.1 DUF6473 family protein [Roseibacterium beibuensis]
MSFVHRGYMPLDYQPVVYPGSVLRFRGPAVDLSRPYILCLGGAETFGRFIHAPYAEEMSRQLGQQVVNMGVIGAGMDVMMNDGAIQRAMRGASAVVLQVTGAQNMTNRFYSVHPRRNDRFLKASSILSTIYRDVDFTEFHFTRHLLTHLKSRSRDRFAILREELQVAWRARMAKFLSESSVPVHLLWLSNRLPGEDRAQRGLGMEPLFLTQAMLDDVAHLARSVTVAVRPPAASRNPTRGMFFAAREEAAARVLPGPEVHRDAARALATHLSADGAMKNPAQANRRGA